MCMILLSGVLMYMHHGRLETIGYPLAFLLTCTVYIYTHVYTAGDHPYLYIHVHEVLYQYIYMYMERSI